MIGSAEPQLGMQKENSNYNMPEDYLTMNANRGWYSRGYLPHSDNPSAIQMITYRLSDSLPLDAMKRLDSDLRDLDNKRLNKERWERLENLMDAGHGCCILKDPRAATCIVNTWKKFDGMRYDLIAWVVMPNHVHVLIRVFDGFSLGKIIQSWKSYTGRRIRRLLISADERNESGGHQLGNRKIERSSLSEKRSPVWMREYWDRYIRNEKHFQVVVDYIHYNPVKAGLTGNPNDWPWSSAAEFGGLTEKTYCNQDR